MDQLNNRVLDYKGYQVVVYDNGDIIMYRHGRFVMQALCSRGMSDEEVQRNVDSMLSLREKLNAENQYVDDI